MPLDLQTVPDEELARQTQAGSLAAFEELVSRYEGRIYRFAGRFCRAEVDAREVAQATFVRAYQAISQFDARQSFAAWLFTIARRKCIDLHRAAIPLSAVEAPEQPDLDDPAELLARQEERQNLWRLARQHLPAAQFEALWFRYAEDLNVAEIARVLGKTQTHVKVLLFRARRMLARELKAEGASAGNEARASSLSNGNGAKVRGSAVLPILQSPHS